MRTTVATLMAAGLALASGCTPDAYRRDADRQVARILRERKQAALGYEPESAAADAPAPAARKSAYRKVPLTAVPPPGPPAIEIPNVTVPYGPLGPERDAAAAGMGPPPPDGEGDRGAAAGVPGDGGDGGGGEFEDFSRLAMGPPAPWEGGHKLDLFGALRYAVQNSREYQDRMEDLYLAALDVTLERHLFAPRPFARAGLEYTGGQADVDYRSALAATASAGVRQQLPYGGEVVAETLVRFVDAINGEVEDGESADVVLSGSLPLLRGAGLVNLEPLVASEREVVYAVRGFEVFRRAFVVDVASQYFGLLAQQQNITNRLLNYANLADLLERTQALFEAGDQPALEVQRARQSLLAGENALIDARQAYENALDDFKVTLGMDVNEQLDVLPVELQVAVPEIRGIEPIETAYKFRLELQTARDRISDAVRQVEVARNGLLPGLDLTARGATGNRAGTPARQLDARTLEYSAGLQLDLPVDRLAERNAYRRAAIAFDRAQRAFEDTRDQVAAQVRSDVRGIRSAQSSLDIQGESVRLAEQRLELANDRLRLGVEGADAREVVEAQEDLLQAQDAYERAQAQLQIRVLEFLRDTGTLRVDPGAGEIGLAMARAAGEGPRGANPDENAGPVSQ